MFAVVNKGASVRAVFHAHGMIAVAVSVPSTVSSCQTLALWESFWIAEPASEIGSIPVRFGDEREKASNA